MVFVSISWVSSALLNLLILKSAFEQPQVVSKLNKEHDASGIEGSFPKPPFQNFRCSPLSIVPKKDTSEFCLIHHLSYPLAHLWMILFPSTFRQFAMRRSTMPYLSSNRRGQVVLWQKQMSSLLFESYQFIYMTALLGMKESFGEKRSVPQLLKAFYDRQKREG